MTVLNCNRINGNVITENTARINFYGKLDTIGNIYSGARLETDGVLSGFDIDGVLLPKEDAKVFYIALWWNFFKENTDIAKTIIKYDDYEDGLPANIANSTAGVFRMLKSYGVNGLGSNCKEFLINLRNERNRIKSNTLTPFEAGKRRAEYLVRTFGESLEREEIMEKAREEGGENLMRLTSLVYDKKTGVITDGLYQMQTNEIRRDFEKVGEEQEEIRLVLE